MRHERNYFELMEKILSCCGAKPQKWSFSSRFYRTCLTVTRPCVVTPMVNGIILGAKIDRAGCIVMACTICHVNLEFRGSSKGKAQILSFSGNHIILK